MVAAAAGGRRASDDTPCSGSASAATPDLRIVTEHRGWALVEGINGDGKRVCSLETGNVFGVVKTIPP